MDGSDQGITARIYRPEIVQAMRAMGLPRLSYRLRTELAIQAWHWNPTGSWSEPQSSSGYWTSAATAAPGGIVKSWGYRLPRRGSTTDQANDDGYSRLTDGDPHSFWKSNPYLDRAFTGEPNAVHPQWVVVDLEKPAPVQSLRLHWATPYATRFRVEYATGAESFEQTMEEPVAWRAFPQGTVENGRGGDQVLPLAPHPLKVRFLRLWLLERSTPTKPPSDSRDACGYALKELEVLGTKGNDLIRHTKNHNEQTPTWVSSTDPWHRARDQDKDTEQPGLDTVFASGLTSGLPLLTPVSVVYDTPENALALLHYLRERRLPVTQLELGEEPDGQYITPEDYGALYLQWARALHSADPRITLGGPSFQTAVEGWIHWPDSHGDRSWYRRFLHYLKAHQADQELGFFTFEWYPFDELFHDPATQLKKHPKLLDDALARLQSEGLSRKIPWMISEYGWSPFAARPEVDLPGALLNAEIVARFLLRGGTTAYLYGYEPATLLKEKNMKGASWGNLTPFLADDTGTIQDKLPTYWSAFLLTQVWAQPGEERHQLYEATASHPDVGVYALKRPDGRWALLLLNRDGKRTYHVQLPDGPHWQESWRYSGAEYAWKEAGKKSHPMRSLPPTRSRLTSPIIELPPFSLSVARSE